MNFLKKPFLMLVRNHSHNRVKIYRKPVIYQTVNSQIQTLRARGFLRPLKPYQPPQDVDNRLDAIVKEMHGVKNFKEQKFEFLVKCEAQFKHSVPNSLLFEMKSLNEIYDFYNTPVDVQTPYEALVKDNNLPNLHIIPDAKRFDPETDGVSAFPKSSTLVTGLRNRKKFKGHIAKTSWP